MTRIGKARRRERPATLSHKTNELSKMIAVVMATHQRFSFNMVRSMVMTPSQATRQILQLKPHEF